MNGNIRVSKSNSNLSGANDFNDSIINKVLRKSTSNKSLKTEVFKNNANELEGKYTKNYQSENEKSIKRVRSQENLVKLLINYETKIETKKLSEKLITSNSNVSSRFLNNCNEILTEIFNNEEKKRINNGSLLSQLKINMKKSSKNFTDNGFNKKSLYLKQNIINGNSHNPPLTKSNETKNFFLKSTCTKTSSNLLGISSPYNPSKLTQENANKKEEELKYNPSSKTDKAMSPIRSLREFSEKFSPINREQREKVKEKEKEKVKVKEKAIKINYSKHTHTMNEFTFEFGFKKNPKKNHIIIDFEKLKLRSSKSNANLKLASPLRISTNLDANTNTNMKIIPLPLNTMNITGSKSTTNLHLFSTENNSKIHYLLKLS